MLADPASSSRPPTGASCSASIRDQARRLDRLVAQPARSLAARGRSGEPLPELWPVDELVGAALEAIGPTATASSSRCAELPGGRGRRCPGRARARQPRGERPRVLLADGRRSRCGAAGGGEVVDRRSVDRGPGIPAREQEAVSSRSAWPVAGERGTGLGLAIARGFADAERGPASGPSRAGRGATFSLALPAVEIDAGVPT